jgi:amino acid adenylation domain-containing protein
MMTHEVFSNLARQDVHLWSDGESLRVRAPKDVLTPELRAMLAAYKADLLALLREREDSGAGALPQIVPDPEHRYDCFPLTDIQQAYWVGRSGAIELGNVACHAYYEIEATDIDLPRLGLAFNRLIDRHDMLRAIVLADGRQQALDRVPPYEIKLLDLRGHGARQAEVVLDAIRHRMSHQMLPSDRWPLFEIRASRLDDVRVRLHFSFDILVADVWSLQILFREWAELYRDMDAQLPPIDLRFRDYVLAEAELRDSKLYRASRQYWEDRLPVLPPAPDLPLAISPSSVTNPRFLRRSGRLESKSWARIKQRAADAGLTASGALLAAFAEVLTAWCKSPRFTINVTLLNRLPLHPQVNEIVGDFTTLIPLAVDNSSAGPFEDRAGRIQAQLFEDLGHRFVGGVQIMRDLARARGRTPGAVMPIVFTSLLSQYMTGARADQMLWMGKVVYGITQTPQVWLDHQVLEEDGALIYNWDAVEQLFPDGMLQDMFDAYRSLLDRLGNEECAWHEQIRDLLPPAQARQQAAVNRTEVAAPPVMLQTLFQQQVSQRARQAAVIAANGSLTYEELGCRANNLARKLSEMGARPNTLIAVVMEKGWEQVVALMGILQSGAAYLPIDPGLPEERLRHLLDHGRVRVALTQSRTDKRLRWPSGIERISVDTLKARPLDGMPVEDAQTPQDLAYVIYTSGSTGLPKGVMIDHAGAVNTILDVNRRFRVGPGDKVFAISNLWFDLSVYDVFGTLAAGGTIVMPEASGARDPAHWAELIRREKVTVWNSVPALMEMLVAHASGGGECSAESLRLVLLSGDWIPVSLPGKVEELTRGARVISLGGATEASIWSILYQVCDRSADLASIPYGRPMANQRFFVLSEEMEPVPTWVQGDLYIAGMGLALGYWNDEARTKESFITHPRTGERLYRTGDLGRYLPDGNIEFLGRKDFQVKLCGYRVELGEVEAALGKHPLVRSSAVVAVGPRESRRLVAYVAADRGSWPTVDDLSQYLKDKLPSYMVPSCFVILDSLPLTPNGKVDRKALPDQVKAAAPPGHSQEERKSVEERIAACIASILKLDHIGADMNLLELGANSVDMIRIAALLEKGLNFRPKIDDFYDNPTPAGLAMAYHEWVSLHHGPGDRARPSRREGRGFALGCEEGEI